MTVVVVVMMLMMRMEDACGEMEGGRVNAQTGQQASAPSNGKAKRD